MKNKEKLIAETVEAMKRLVKECDTATGIFERALEECEVKEWWPRSGGYYQWVGGDGRVATEFHRGNKFDLRIIEYGLGPFYPGNDILPFTKKLHALCRLKKIADQLNDGWVPDWSDYSEKYVLCKQNNCDVGTISLVFCRDCLPVFKSQELAEKALEWMGDEAEDLFID